ncbi:MAG: CBS domain-containing protein [Caldilineales bacterium]|nr:CBS domain-containing protein [Caldilineales bacterium]
MEVILAHEHTDFDALASMLAANKLFPEAIPVLPRKINRNLRDFLVLYRSSLPFRAANELPRESVEQAIFVDTQTAQSVRGMTSKTPIRIIDHHPQEPNLPERYHFWGEPVGATTTILVEQILARGIPLSAIEATLLLLGIYEDTGSLSYTSTTSRDLRCAAGLLERGANLEVVNNFLHHPLTPGQQALLKELTENAETLDISGNIVVIASSEAGEYVDEISTVAHKMRDLFDPDGLFLIVDLGDRIQLVARSTTGLIHVGEVAEAFGGGGHARAAAAPITDSTVEEVRQKLLHVLHDKVRPPMTVGDIMSLGVNTLLPSVLVSEADQRMRRLGHEGFPVAENGRLIGLITRRDIDNAIHHNMQGYPVRRVMRSGQFTVTTDDSIHTLQKRMMEAGWGQVPVVGDDGEMIGIVTRTDLLKLWAPPEEKSLPASVAEKMEEALPAALLELLLEVGRLSAELGFSLYAVGGFARDLILGYPNFDVDLVVEGDAEQLAHALARTHGGRVRSHRQFSTAKWIRDENAFAAGTPLADGTASSLDFATARIEFYEEATALPVVESANIKLDLHRRDFTINTLAIRLDTSHWGELLDFYGGGRDLQRGTIRVLHSLSFVEDPTRILRAARFEQRFGFRIEARTLELIADALDLLQRVSGAHIRHEFDLIFQEQEPEKSLSRLSELGVLSILHPALAWEPYLDAKFSELRMAVKSDATPPEAMERLYLALWQHRKPARKQREMLVALRAGARTRRLVEEGIRFRTIVPELLTPDMPNSQLDQMLSSFSEAALLVAQIDADDDLVRQRLDLYRTQLQSQTIALNGEDLRAMGIRPGPVYREIFQSIRAARLDGEIKTRADEEILARTILAERPPSSREKIRANS